MYVKDYMSTSLITIDEDTTVTNALDLMNQHDIHRLPVVKRGRIVGLVSDSDIAKSTPSQMTSLSVHEVNYLLNKTTAKQIMTREAVHVNPDTLIEEAASQMRLQSVSVVLVVDTDGQLVGIMTEKDVMDALIDVLGYNLIGTRITVDVAEDRAGILEELGRIARESDMSYEQIAVYDLAGMKQIVLHVSNMDTEDLVKKFEENGFNVSSVMKRG